MGTCRAAPRLADVVAVLRSRVRAVPLALRVAVAAGVVAFLLHSAVIVTDGLRDRAVPADLAVVLGTRVEPDGEPAPPLAARLDAAAALWHDGLVPDLLVSGGPAPGGHQEAAVMAAGLEARGVPPERILQDPNGVDTWASAAAVAEHLARRGGGEVLVVSQYHHLSRAELALRRHGVAVAGTVHARYADIRDLWSLVREFPGYYWYLIRPLG